MNKIVFLILILICFYVHAFSQNPGESEDNTLLKELAENGCKCVDSIDVYNKSKEEVATEIGRCIDGQTGAYQMGAKLGQATSNLVGDKNGNSEKKDINISIDLNKDSQEYKTYYFELERYMMENCTSLKMKIAQREKQSAKSYSEIPDAMEWYSKGVAELKDENLKKAIKYFENAIKEDPEFAFAWDNLGLCYRKLEDYDKAIEAYQKSLEIDPQGEMPLQNIAVAYQYKGEFQKAIDAYKRLAEFDKNNPEIYYGIGRIYAGQLHDLEEGLSNMCKAYNLYIEQKSPYRTDAEKIISQIYVEMKKQGKEDKFREILKTNGIQLE